METTAIQQTLNKALLQLNPTSTWPVNLHGILPRLGIRLRFEEKKGKAEAHLQLGATATIVVYRTNSDLYLTAKERFSIAHELAHWVVWRRFRFLPSAETYWDHETLCNQFAAELLMPTRGLQQFLDKLYKEKVNPIFFPEKVKNSAAVSWDAAAKRISAVCPADLAYLQLIKVNPKTFANREDGEQQSTIFKVKCSSLTNRLGSFVGQQSFVRARTELLEWMEQLPKRTFKRRDTVLTSGNLCLSNVFCTFLRDTNHWVVSFCPSNEGITIDEGGRARNSTSNPMSLQISTD